MIAFITSSDLKTCATN